MHGHDVAERQQVVENREDALLHLTGVLGAGDEHDLFGEVENDGGLGSRAVLCRIRVKCRREEQGKLRHVIFRLQRIRPDEQLPPKQTMPGSLRDHADRHGIGGVGAGKAVLHENILSLPIGQHTFVKGVELLPVHRLIHRAPVNRGFGARLADDVFVLGRTPCELPGSDHKRPTARQHAFVALDGVLDQLCRAEIPICGLNIAEAMSA